MNKKVKIALIVVSVSAVALIGIKLYKKRKKNKLGSGVGSSPVSGSSSKSRFPLSKGSGMSSRSYQNADVKVLQKHLNKISPTPLLPLEVDGKFGSKTEARLIRMYKVNSVSKDLFNKF